MTPKLPPCFAGRTTTTRRVRYSVLAAVAALAGLRVRVSDDPGVRHRDQRAAGRHRAVQDQHAVDELPLRHPSVGLLPGQRCPEGGGGAEAVSVVAADPTR